MDTIADFQGKGCSEVLSKQVYFHHSSKQASCFYRVLQKQQVQYQKVTFSKMQVIPAFSSWPINMHLIVDIFA